MLIARPSPLTLYTTLCIAAGPVVSVGVVEAVGGGTAVRERGDVRVVGVVVSGLDPGMAGKGGTAVWVLIAPLASISAITSATTSSTAAPAAINNHRGDFGPFGGGGDST